MRKLYLFLTLLIAFAISQILDPAASAGMAAIAIGSTFTEPNYAADIILDEEEVRASREQVTVLHGQVLVPGTVIGKLIAAAQAAAAASGNAGNGTVTGVSLSSDFKVGVYAFSCSAAASNGGTFKVEDPDGDILGDATVGAGFTSPQINFTINDGTNDFHVGDSFTLAVNAADGQVKALDLSAVNGSQRAYGAMIAPADATAADVPGVAVTNRAVLKESGLVWPAGITDTQKAAALAQLKEKFITVRKGA